MAKRKDKDQGAAADSDLIGIAGKALAKSEDKVDRFLKALGIKVGGGERALRRLDRAFLVATSGSGLAKGVGSISPRGMKVPATALNRVSTVTLLSAAALYITAHARVRGISTDDPRVQQMMREALTTSAMLPAGQVALQEVAPYVGKSAGLPSDPRTWMALAAGATVGGYSGKTIGDRIVAAVNEAFDNDLYESEGVVVSEEPLPMQGAYDPAGTSAGGFGSAVPNRGSGASTGGRGSSDYAWDSAAGFGSAVPNQGSGGAPSRFAPNQNSGEFSNGYGSGN